MAQQGAKPKPMRLCVWHSLGIRSETQSMQDRTYERGKSVNSPLGRNEDQLCESDTLTAQSQMNKTSLQILQTALERVIHPGLPFAPRAAKGSSV